MCERDIAWPEKGLREEGDREGVVLGERQFAFKGSP